MSINQQPVWDGQRYVMPAPPPRTGGYWNPNTRRWEMYYANPPSIWPTLIITALFGFFGLLPAAIHSNRAQQMGRNAGIYWVVWLCVMVAWVATIYYLSK